jgi:hypothetical protein
VTQNHFLDKKKYAPSGSLDVNAVKKVIEPRVNKQTIILHVWVFRHGAIANYNHCGAGYKSEKYNVSHLTRSQKTPVKDKQNNSAAHQVSGV